MTEIKSKIQNLLPYKREVRTTPKRWLDAHKNPYKDSRSDSNYIIEVTYHDIIKFAKSLYSQLQTTSKRTAFERDYKHDSTENSLAMHTFMTRSCYLHLECSYDYLYRIRYDFYKCPFEDQIMEKLQLREDYSPGSCRHWKTTPNCKEFFDSVIQVQDAKFITVLPQISISAEKES